MTTSPLMRVLRPRTLFHFISLLTATEFITISLLINKVEGVYGILALFTGYHLSALQLSMYVYSIIVFALVCYLGPHIRQQSPLQVMTLAWIYILDTVINAVYTALFGLSWFILLAQHLNPSPSTDSDSRITTPGGKMINDTAGFTDPTAGTSDKVEIIAEPRPNKFPPGQEAVAYPVGNGGSLGGAIFQSGSIMSITVICILWSIRFYFVLIIMAYARQVLRGYAQSASFGSKSDGTAPTDTLLANPFARTAPSGQGWKGRLGRLLTRFPAAYWLGQDEQDEEWVRGADERFRMRSRSRQQGPTLRDAPASLKGTSERERRARSGTGPPLPGMELLGRRSGESSAAESRISSEQ